MWLQTVAVVAAIAACILLVTLGVYFHRRATSAEGAGARDNFGFANAIYDGASNIDADPVDRTAAMYSEATLIRPDSAATQMYEVPTPGTAVSYNGPGGAGEAIYAEVDDPGFADDHNGDAKA